MICIVINHKLLCLALFWICSIRLGDVKLYLMIYCTKHSTESTTLLVRPIVDEIL